MREGQKAGSRKPRFDKDKKFALKKKVCKLCTDKMVEVDMYDVKRLRGHITERGKIIPARISGACAKHQRKLTRVIKRARTLALLPYIAD